VTVRPVSGISAIVTGALGLLAVIVARHGESFRGTGSAYLLNLADRLGFIKSPPSDGIPQASAPGLLSFTDETALQAVLGFGTCLGVLAMLLAVHGSRRREDSLYLGAGLICGWLAILVANYAAGMTALLIGAAVVLAVRSRQRERP